MGPKLIREDHNVILAQDTFFGEEIAAEEEGAAEHLVEAGCNLPAIEIFRLVFAGDVEGAAGEGVDVLEAGVFALPIREISSGDAIVEGLTLRPDDDELVRLGVWHWGEEGGVVNGEDGGVSADAEGESDKNCEGEAGVLPQRSHGVAKITKETRHQTTSQMQLRFSG